MQTDGNAVQKIAELAREGQNIEELVHEIGEHTFSTIPLHHLPPKGEVAPPTLELSTLKSLVEYLEANRDSLTRDKLVLHVETPTKVTLLGELFGEKRQRFVYARATCEDLVSGFVDRHHPQEAFVIALQSRFVQTDDTAALLKLVGRLRLEEGVEQEDDGRTQRASARSGVHLSDDVEVPNPVTLVPYRTFREVEQPIVPFVLRVAKNMGLGIWEADGGAWRISTTQAVGNWLMEQVDRVPVLY